MSNKNGPASRRAGFTLVELMVTVTIMMLAIGGGAVYVGNFNNRQKLRSAKSELLSALKQARNIAKVSQKPSSIGNPLKVQNCVELVLEGTGNRNLTVQTDQGDEYFSKAITDPTVNITVDSTGGGAVTKRACFRFYQGNLMISNGIGDTMIPYPNEYKTVYTLTTEASVGTTESISVDATGTINE